jgi:hypothetical protein
MHEKSELYIIPKGILQYEYISYLWDLINLMHWGALGTYFVEREWNHFLPLPEKLIEKSSGQIKVTPLMAVYDVSGVAALKLKSSFIEM